MYHMTRQLPPVALCWLLSCQKQRFIFPVFSVLCLLSVFSAKVSKLCERCACIAECPNRLEMVVAGFSGLLLMTLTALCLACFHLCRLPRGRTIKQIRKLPCTPVNYLWHLFLTYSTVYFCIDHFILLPCDALCCTVFVIVILSVRPSVRPSVCPSV